MGRPRKEFHRLTRTITVRVEDDQYDWLVDHAMEEMTDLSKATRDAIESARTLERILNAEDPFAKFKDLLERSEDAALRELAGIDDDDAD
jgi:hypothetical protein